MKMLCFLTLRIYNHFAIAEGINYIDSLLGRNKRPNIVVYTLAVIELKKE